MAKRPAVSTADFEEKLRNRLNQMNSAGNTRGNMVLNTLPAPNSVSLEEVVKNQDAATNAAAPAASMPTDLDFDAKAGQLADIPLDKIDTNASYQTRFALDEEHVEATCNAFQASGQREPIKLRRNGDRYELLSGHHRFESALRIGWITIQALVYEMTHEEALMTSLLQNAGRKNESAYELAVAMTVALENNLVRGQAGLAAAWGLSQGRVSQILNILKLPAEILAVARKHPHLLNSRTIKPVRELCEAHPEHVTTVAEGLLRIIDGSDESTVKAWVLQSIQQAGQQVAQVKSRIIPSSSGTPLFVFKNTNGRITIELKGDKSQAKRIEQIVFDTLSETAKTLT